METLFRVVDELGDAVARFTDAPPHVRAWVNSVHQRGELRTIVVALIRAKKANTVDEALQRIAVMGADFEKKSVVTVGDFRGIASRSLRRLADIADFLENDEQAHNDTVYRFHGTISHQVITSLARRSFERSIGKQMHTVTQLPLFNGADAYPAVQLSLIDTTDIFFVDRVVPPPFTKKWLRALERIWSRMTKVLTEDSFAFEISNTLAQIFPELRDLFMPVFRKELSSVLRRTKAVGAQQLTILTAMTWASIALDSFGKDPLALLTEIPVLHKRHGMNGGRTDGLEIVAIDGRCLTDEERAHIDRCIVAWNHEKFSIGQITHLVEQFFSGHDVTFRILDWKCAVGDAVNACAIIQDVPEPFQKHVEQVQRYLTLAWIDYQFSDARGLALANRGVLRDPFTEAVLVYALPHRLPIRHTVRMTKEEKETFFQTNIALRWESAFGKAALRTFENYIVQRVLKEVSGNGSFFGNGIPTKPKQNGNEVAHEQLFTIPEPPTVASMVLRKRVFVDEGKVIEMLKDRQGNDLYCLHVDALIRALAVGTIVAERGFSWERGGKITCLMHPKPDEHPSFHLYTSRGYGKCFSCGAFARFSELSIPNGVPIQIASGRSSLATSATKTVAVPESHHQTVWTVSLMCNRNFRNSVGERYLVRERMLDPDCAHAHNVGYWDETAMKYIFEMGVTFADLVRCGCIGFSDRLPRERSLVPFLIRRNVSERDAVREKKLFGGTRKIIEYPYPIMDGRLTMPLTIGGRYASIYGRDAQNRGKEFAHRKLVVEKGGIPHGMFHESILREEHQEVLAVEGALDALTLIEMGHANAGALIGVKNTVILDLFAQSGKRIGIALDNDAGGIDATYGATVVTEHSHGTKHSRRVPGLIEWFAARSIYNVYDFTKQFAVEHPGDWDDWNTWWKKKKRGELQ